MVLITCRSRVQRRLSYVPKVFAVGALSLFLSIIPANAQSHSTLEQCMNRLTTLGVSGNRAFSECQSNPNVGLPAARPKAGGCNFYGCYAGGGGCNMNGCYPSGGGCNFYGCWEEGGSCGMNGCVNQISPTKYNLKR